MSLPCSILFVDDDVEILETMLRRFTKRGFHVVGASHPRQALGAVNQQEFQVAVLDRSLPEMDGLALMNKLHSLVADLQVIILSGHVAENDEHDAISQVAFAYLTKPCSLRTLEQAIKSAATHLRCGEPTVTETQKCN